MVGISSIVSAAAVFEEMRRLQPDLLQRLLIPMAHDRRGEVPAGQKPFCVLSIRGPPYRYVVRAAILGLGSTQCKDFQTHRDSLLRYSYLNLMLNIINAAIGKTELT